MRTVAELVLGRDPDTVPRARRFVSSLLAGEAPHLVANAELVVTELVTNAALHAEPPIVVRLYLDAAVRIEVEDAGRGLPILVGPNFEAMTGRGLSMVEAVANEWGVQPTVQGGKMVWADLDTNGAGGGLSEARRDIESLVASRAAQDQARTAYTVKLGAVPTSLLLAAKAHMDNVVRELLLLREGQASSGVALPPALAALVEIASVDFAEARAEIKRQAAAAEARGDPVVDLVLRLPPSAADAGERYLAALDEADRYARAARLLTLAPPAEHRVFRRWYVQSLVDQLRALAHGQLPPRPRSFEQALAEEYEPTRE